MIGSTSEIVTRPLPADDPLQRQPDIALARARLGWEPRCRSTTAWSARLPISGRGWAERAVATAALGLYH